MRVFNALFDQPDFEILSGVRQISQERFKNVPKIGVEYHLYLLPSKALVFGRGGCPFQPGRFIDKYMVENSLS